MSMYLLKVIQQSAKRIMLSVDMLIRLFMIEIKHYIGIGVNQMILM